MSIMVMMSFLAVKLLALPGLLWSDCKNMGWFATLVAMTVDLVFTLLIVDLMRKNQNKNFYEFAKDTIGSFCAKIVLIFLLVHYAIIMAIICKGLEFFVIENLYEEFTWLLFGAPLMAVVGFMIYKGVRNIARLFEFFWFPILIACVYIVAKSLTGVELTTFLPMFQDGVEPIAKSVFEHIAWFGSSTFLLMIFGQVDFTNSKKRNLVIFSLVGVLLVQLMYFVFYGLFDATSPTHQFCVSDVAQFTSSRSSVGELSWLVVSLWIVAQTAQIAMYGYAMVKAFMLLFNIKSSTIGVMLFYVGFVLWGFFGTKGIEPEKIFYHPITSVLTIFTAYVIPIILFIANAVKQSNNKKNSCESSATSTNQSPYVDNAKSAKPTDSGVAYEKS